MSSANSKSDTPSHIRGGRQPAAGRPGGEPRRQRGLAALPGGLVTAFEPVMRSHRGAWVGWPGAPDEELEPFANDGLQLIPVAQSATEVEQYYEGFSNATLWPIYHDVIAPPEFHREWWDTYVVVNQRFADRTAEIAAPGAVVWVQDYQLQLVPQMLRKQRPTCGSGSSCTSRSRPPSSTPNQRPGGTRSSRACSARTWWASACLAARRTSSAWSATGYGWTPSGTRSPRRAAQGDGAGVPHRHRCQELPRSRREPGGRRTGRRDPQRPG